MGDIVNLKRFRKSLRRAAAEKRAEENRLRHGRNKAARAEVRRETEKAARDLDGKRFN